MTTNVMFAAAGVFTPVLVIVGFIVLLRQACTGLNSAAGRRNLPGISFVAGPLLPSSAAMGGARFCPRPNVRLGRTDEALQLESASTTGLG